ncbi:MAG: hypothetical protein IKV66_14530, partial [Clostridia bacterium]|nr:hypothetical protein [Clostridia bacterium]
MNYQELKQKTNVGWNTWNTLNVLSYSHLPEGFTVNLSMQEYSDAAMLRESLIGRHNDADEKIVPGARTYGINCSQMTLTWRGMKLDVRTTGSEEELIVLITPLEQTCIKTQKLIIEACLMWGREGIVGKKDGHLFGECGDKRFDIYVSEETENAVYTRSLSPAVAVVLDRPIVVSSRPCTAEEAMVLWTAEKAKLDTINNAFGTHSEAYTAMKTCLAWDTIYEMEHDRICSTVSRIWNGSGYVLFDWDTYFAALM